MYGSRHDRLVRSVYGSSYSTFELAQSGKYCSRKGKHFECVGKTSRWDGHRSKFHHGIKTDFHNLNDCFIQKQLDFFLKFSYRPLTSWVNINYSYFILIKYNRERQQSVTVVNPSPSFNNPSPSYLNLSQCLPNLLPPYANHWLPMYYFYLFINWKKNWVKLLHSVHTASEKFDNTAFIISTVWPAVHSNASRKRSFWKRHSNRRNLKTPAFPFRVGKKHFEKGSFLKLRFSDNCVLRKSNFIGTTISLLLPRQKHSIV